MIKIKVKAAGGVTKFMPEGVSEKDIEITEGTAVGGLLDALGVPHDGPSIILVNRVVADLDGKLSDGDTVHLLPMVVGG
jgi:sulfur carrier protein ThiS